MNQILFNLNMKRGTCVYRLSSVLHYLKLVDESPYVKFTDKVKRKIRLLSRLKGNENEKRKPQASSNLKVEC